MKKIFIPLFINYIRIWDLAAASRVDKFIAGGWSLVFDKDISDVDLSTQASQLSSAIRKVANKNPQATVKTCVLMKIPKEMYDEDQAEKQAAHEQEMKAFDLKYRLGLDGISGTINRK